MTMDGDYIVISRKIQQWEWYKNSNTMRVFIHCLLNANWKDGRIEGIDVPRGTFATSLPRLSADLGMSVMQIRTALNHLKLTGELTVTPHPRFSLITVKNYDQYQLDNRLCNSQITGCQEEGMKRDEENGDEKGTKEERERSKEKEESGLKAEDREAEKSKEVEGKKREKENNILKKEVLKKENPKKAESMEQMYERISVDYELSDPLYDKLKEWFRYKQERRQTYKEAGMRSLMKKAVNCSHEYSDLEVCDLIDFSMQSNYQGIFWDRLGKTKGSATKSFYDKWRDA